jgi:predicted flap endonuclease-1-like 5' DNA nuclease
MTPIIVVLLLCLLAFALGWLLSNIFGGGTTEIDNSENEYLLKQIAAKEQELAQCRSNRANLSAKVSANKASVPTVAAASAVVASSIAPVADTSGRKDDLKIVEGIGPKIEELLHNAGILTFEQLANASKETIDKILEEAGPRYQMHDPTTWPAQSKLCAEGKWTELKVLQDELNKGKAE